MDTPVSPTTPATHFLLYGWCFHRQGLPITAMRARIGRRLFPGLHGRARPDVSAAFGGVPGSGTSGYEIAVSLPVRPQPCHLEARLDDGGWHAVQTFSLTPPPHRVWRERLRWSRFWANAWLGRPQAWPLVSPEEQRYLLGWAQHRGWLNIGIWSQYAPRPVAEERFPAPHRPAGKLPKITIVTPSFNQAAFLEATMRSVLDQPGVRLDYIVQDGGSTDGSADLVRRYAPRLKHGESAPDDGQADALRRGFARSECGPDDVMAYLNSDDLLMPGTARFVAEYFARHPAVDVVYGHRVLIDDDSMEIGRWYSPRRACDDLRLHDLVPQETLFWRKRIWDRVGGVDPSFHFAVDWDLLLRFEAAGARIARLPWFLGQFRLHPQQKTQKWIERVGIPEMDRLRLRTLGRMPAAEEMQASMRRAQFDSALVCALFQRGWRL
ncbi:MAG: glycosyltransferase family 2 protein [Opitutaceae bacterium]|nr:glycosyltransferase family 2 protein [Opitutaceae bacterium]